MAEQRELLPIEHRSLQPKRLKNYGHVNPEAIFAAEWKAIQKRIPRSPRLHPDARRCACGQLHAAAEASTGLASRRGRRGLRHPMARHERRQRVDPERAGEGQGSVQ